MKIKGVILKGGFKVKINYFTKYVGMKLSGTLKQCLMLLNWTLYKIYKKWPTKQLVKICPKFHVMKNVHWLTITASILNFLREGGGYMGFVTQKLISLLGVIQNDP